MVNTRYYEQRNQVGSNPINNFRTIPIFSVPSSHHLKLCSDYLAFIHYPTIASCCHVSDKCHEIHLSFGNVAVHSVLIALFQRRQCPTHSRHALMKDPTTWISNSRDLYSCNCDGQIFSKDCRIEIPSYSYGGDGQLSLDFRPAYIPPV